MMTRARWTVGVVCVLGAAFFCGGAECGRGRRRKRSLRMGGVASSLTAAPVIGQPYSATVAHQSSQKLSDGTTVSKKGHHFTARDSQGTRSCGDADGEGEKED